MFQVTITIQSSKIPEEDELKNLAIKELTKKRINIKNMLFQSQNVCEKSRFSIIFPKQSP